MERKTLAAVIEKMEQADEILSQELDHFEIRSRRIKQARDILQDAVNNLEEMVYSKSASTGEGEAVREQLE